MKTRKPLPSSYNKPEELLNNAYDSMLKKLSFVPNFKITPNSKKFYKEEIHQACDSTEATNFFTSITIDDHQMSVAGKGLGIMSGVWRGMRARSHVRRTLYREAQFIKGYGHMGPPYSLEHTDACENITFSQL